MQLVSNNFKIFFWSLIIFAIASRLLAIFYFGDTKIDNEWGVILSNLENHRVFAFRSLSVND